MQRPGDRSRAERQHVDLEAKRAEELLLGDAEALLLVEDDEAQLLRDHVAAENAVRPDQDVDLAFLEVGEHLLHLARRAEPRDHLHAHREVAVARPERVPVLLGEDRGRRKHQSLLAVDGHGEGRADGDLRLPEADVAAHEAVHRTWRLEVLLHRLDRRLLVGRLSIRELGLEPLEVLVAKVVRDTGRLLPLRIESKELAGQLAYGLARATLEVLPGLAPQLREGGHRAVGADVARDLAELLVRDVEPVVTTEPEKEVIAGDAGHLLRLEPDELPDPVVLVDDVVPGAQVGEGLERAAAGPPLARRPFAEHLRVGKQDEPEVAPDEAAPRRRDREEKRGLLRQRLALLENSCVGAPEEVLLPQRLAEVRKRDDNTLARPDEGRELVFRLGEPARDERGPLRLECERLARRQRVDRRGARERDRREPFLLPHGSHFVRLPDEIWSRGHGQNQVVRNGSRELSLLHVLQRRVDEIEPAFRRRVDNRRLERVERTLRERRERPDVLDLVAPELDAERLTARRREDVDEPAADGELAALVRPLDPLVAGESERFRQGLEADVRTGRDPDRRRSGPRGWNRLGERRRRGDDEAPFGEHVERPCALAHEVGCRLEAGAPANTAARKHRDTVLIEEPRGRLCGVARVLVLGREKDERPRELVVQRSEDERQRGLGDARGSWKGLGVRPEPLAPPKLCDERIQDRRAHLSCSEPALARAPRRRGSRRRRRPSPRGSRRRPRA